MKSLSLSTKKKCMGRLVYFFICVEYDSHEYHKEKQCRISFLRKINETWLNRNANVVPEPPKPLLGPYFKPPNPYDPHKYYHCYESLNFGHFAPRGIKPPLSNLHEMMSKFWETFKYHTNICSLSWKKPLLWVFFFSRGPVKYPWLKGQFPNLQFRGRHLERFSKKKTSLY